MAAWARISSRSSFLAASTRASISRWMSASLRSFVSAAGVPDGGVWVPGGGVCASAVAETSSAARAVTFTVFLRRGRTKGAA